MTENALKEGQNEARKYRTRLLGMGEFTYLKLLATDKQLPIETAYIKLRIHQKQEISFKNPDYTTYTTANTPNEQYLRDQDRLLERSSRAYEPAEAIEKHHLAVIVGDPGAGKTTLMRYLARQSASRKLKDHKLPDLPIYVPISKLTAKDLPEDKNLLDALTVYVQEQYKLNNAKEFLNKVFEEGRALLLLDGLDEAGALSSSEGQNFFIQELATEIDFPSQKGLKGCTKYTAIDTLIQSLENRNIDGDSKFYDIFLFEGEINYIDTDKVEKILKKAEIDASTKSLFIKILGDSDEQTAKEFLLKVLVDPSFDDIVRMSILLSPKNLVSNTYALCELAQTLYTRRAVLGPIDRNPRMIGMG